MSTTWVDPDLNKTPEQLCEERAKRMLDVMQMKQPDRIPIVLGMGYMLSEMGGITNEELYNNPQKAQELLIEAAVKFQPDSIFGTYGGPGPSAVLGDQMTKWPGYGLDENGSFQFAEQEFMKPEDYDEFLEDPSDWAIRTYLPRAFNKLGGLATIPPLAMWAFGFYNLSALNFYASPALMETLQAVKKAIDIQLAGMGPMMEGAQKLQALGFPQVSTLGPILMEAPFDFMSDTLRGMRGIMLDMHKRPEKLLAAEEKVLRTQVKMAVMTAKATGFKTAGIPLHRGSDGFMSIKQFEKFYWPQLKEMMLQLIDNGITPSVFYEGVWDQRLEYLAELPKGKTIGMFQSSDIYKVKEVLGDVMVIQGGMPVSLLYGASVEEIRATTKKLCQEIGKGGGYIMSTGIMELEGAKPELVKAWVDATKEFGTY